MPPVERPADDGSVNAGLPPAGRGPGANGKAPRALKWQHLLPVAIVAGIVVGAVTIQPGGTPADAGTGLDVQDPVAVSTSAAPDTPTAEPTATVVTVASQPSAGQTTPVSATAPGEAVAGAIQTPSATVAAAPTPDLSGGLERTHCGSIQEASVALSVEQNLSGVAVRATNAAVYPVEYLRCILLATGGSEAVTLANAIAQAGRGGATHAVLVDLWVANGNRDFAQLNLRDAEISGAGADSAALGVLNSRGEVVIASGQSRTLTLVVTVAVAFGGTPGPITLGIDAPLVGGEPTKGKYQLFLPTP